MSAAMPAALGAAADVPKNGSNSLLVSATFRLSPSTPVKSGWLRTRGVASALPDVSNKNSVPAPVDENDSSCGGVTPKAGVCVYCAAPTPAAPRATGCPNVVPLLVTAVLIENGKPSVRPMYFMTVGFGPESCSMAT